MKTLRPAALLALVLLTVAALQAPLLAVAPPAAPGPDEAPHGIANQAAEPRPANTVSARETGPVAVPEPSEKALRHARSGNWLWVFDQVWSLLVPGVILFSGFSARIRDAARRIGRNWFFTIVVYFVFFLLITFVIGLPLSYYTGFARPHEYGLSNQTFGKWLSDELKGLMVGLIIGGLLLWIPYRLVKTSPRRWWLWTSLLAIPVAAFFLLIAPIVIDPLFNKFGPMKDKVLEQKILDLAGRAGIQGARVFEVDKSADTNTVNAYVTGFSGSKRIVLWDTTIAKLTPDELLFVMGHEMGHYVLGHVVRSIFFAAGLILVTLYAADRLQDGLIARFSSRFGFTELADIASLHVDLHVEPVPAAAAAPAVNSTTA